MECLADNAIKFTDEPGGVVVLRAYADESVCLAVIDEGGAFRAQCRTSSRLLPDRPREIRRPGRRGGPGDCGWNRAPARRHLSIDSTFGQATFVIRITEDDLEG